MHSNNGKQYPTMHKIALAATATVLFLLVVVWGVPSRMNHYETKRRNDIAEAKSSWHQVGTGTIETKTINPTDYGQAWVDIKLGDQTVNRLVDADRAYKGGKVSVWDCSSGDWQICDSDTATLISAGSTAHPWDEFADRMSQSYTIEDLVSSVSGAIVNLQAIILLTIIGVATWQYHKRRQTQAELWLEENLHEVVQTPR